ncbi:MAG: ABC transporter substrate-binding protein [Bradyrhizobiaceae bacterium]|nr:ABC transporter substrate-binding protein [Bradyrhizobiaceae bacterium]
MSSRYLPSFEFIDVSPITAAFGPMIRKGSFDISEMALATFLQAKALEKDLVLLPVAVAVRFQEDSLVCRADNRSIRSPADLTGRRVGVRAYSQTTGMWVRGLLQDDFGITPNLIKWITFESPHIEEVSDPPWVERGNQGLEMLTLLKSGELDAVILGRDKPESGEVREVYPDAIGAAKRFYEKYKFVPVNHVIVARRAVVEARPKLIEAFLGAVRDAWSVASNRENAGFILPIGRSALEPVISVALRYMKSQAMLPRALSMDEIWDRSVTEAASL